MPTTSLPPSSSATAPKTRKPSAPKAPASISCRQRRKRFSLRKTSFKSRQPAHNPLRLQTHPRHLPHQPHNIFRILRPVRAPSSPYPPTASGRPPGNSPHAQHSPHTEADMNKAPSPASPNPSRGRELRFLYSWLNGRKKFLNASSMMVSASFVANANRVVSSWNSTASCIGSKMESLPKWSANIIKARLNSRDAVPWTR
jgi:hypothetical protein